MSGLQTRKEEHVNGLDVREQGTALRVATSTPHLVSLGTGRLSTAVTIHHIKQGRVTIGSDPTCDIQLQGAGVANIHCRVENSHGVVTLYPVCGGTLIDGSPAQGPTRLAQGSMITLGRSNYLRFNHPEEAKLMKSMLPAGDAAARTQYADKDGYSTVYKQCEQQRYHNNQYANDKPHLNQLDQQLNQTLKEFARTKPPVPKKHFTENDAQDKPKISSIMSKVSKFEYYARQQKNVSRSQFYTNDNEISPKVFSANSPTVNTPAREVLGKCMPKNMQNNVEKVVYVQENNSESKGCSYANVAIRNRSKIDDIVRNFDENRPLPKKIDNTQTNNHVYGKINNDSRAKHNLDIDVKNDMYGRIEKIDRSTDRTDRSVSTPPSRPCLPSPAFDRNPQYSPVYVNSSQFNDRGFEAENRRIQAYQDRIKEEEIKEAENARLEEILNMCAEYEKQVACGSPITPTEKRSHNKIITNGSLPRGAAMNNPNFVQTSDGYYKFDTSHSRNNSLSRSTPAHRNVSSYENFDVTQISSQSESLTPEVTINDSNVGRMDEIGIPVFDENNKHELSSPILIRKVIEQKTYNLQSPIGSPYENVYKNGLRPKSPNTQSPRSRIKTTFAHKNISSPQYFIFPTPPPVDNSNKPSFPTNVNEESKIVAEVNTKDNDTVTKSNTLDGIEKQLSIEDDIPMIDDVSVTDDIEYRYGNVTETVDVKNQSFDDVRKELMADIPELDEFEKDLKQNREKVIKTNNDKVKRVDAEQNSLDSSVINDDSVKELKEKFENLKDRRKKLMTEIHEYKTKMSEIRSQEDDILRELEMEKALIKGEYDSEIAILNIEQKKKMELLESIKKVEEDIKKLKRNQEDRQNEMRDRVEIATLKVERIERDLNTNGSTVEELQNAKDILDNETKIYEDLEFTHLEEESELLAHREDLQNELSVLTKKIDSQKSRILTLKSEANNNLTSALDETKILQAEYVRLLNKVEEITTKIQSIEKELKPIVVKLNDIERAQSPDSAFYTDQTRAKSGEFGYSPQSSDSDDFDVSKISSYEDHTKELQDKFNSIDQMSQSMIVDIERRIVEVDIISESPSKSLAKEKKGFWERNFDSLKRKKDKKPKEDIMSQSLNENMFYNNEIENDTPFDRFNSLRNSKNKKKDNSSPTKSTTSKIPTLAALGKIIKKDSFGKKTKDKQEVEEIKNNLKNRYVKNTKQNSDNKYSKSKTPERILEEDSEFTKNESKKVFHRKSCGDEPFNKNSPKISDTGKIPSQDDIDRISKVTLDAPILSSDTDMNSLGKKTVDSLMEIERNRMAMLEEQGCQVIENEREKIEELKRRVQSETKKLWDQKYKSEHSKSLDSECLEFDSLKSELVNGRTNEVNDDSMDDPFNMTGSTVFEESSGMMTSSIEELQVRNSRAESATEDEKRSDHSRPLSDASDFSRDNMLSLSGAPRRGRATGECRRPLTRYLPVDRDDFDLRTHVESAGHQVELCPHVTVTTTSCRGYLHKVGAKFHTWSKRWFVFDRDTKTFVYYWDKNERKPRGGAYFQVIEEVYLDHGNTSKSPNPQTTFIVKTRQRRYYLMAPSGEAARIWIDVIFTGAQGYTEYLE